MSAIQIHEFPNGLTLVGESMDWLESAAFSLLVPGGCAHDPPQRAGLANFACEMVQRGCGELNSRQFVEKLELLGVDRMASVSNAHVTFGGAMLAERMTDVLPIYADLVRKPHLPAEQLEEGRMVCYQEIHALQDDLAQQTLAELRRSRYPDPYGRSTQGTMESVGQITLEDIGQFFQSNYRPNNAILSVAGKIDFPRIRDCVEEHFGDWSVVEPSQVIEQASATDYRHIEHDSSQTHIAVGYHNVPYGHPDYYQARGAVGVLSDGMSSRLFTEVREKRGLCYTVYASCHSLKGHGSVLCYAGTTTERAQETLDVMVAELLKLQAGIEEEELARLKAKIKSALIMQQESSTARSGSLAIDWYYLQRIQTLEEVGRIVDELSCNSINDYLASHPPRDFRVVTLGEQPLEIPSAIL